MPNAIEQKALIDYVKRIKPSLIVESGTGREAVSAAKFCEALSSNNYGKLITYEVSEEYFNQAKSILKNYFGPHLDMKLEDFINFFNLNLIPEIYFLDAGDEKLVCDDWVVPGKNYGEGTFYAKKESENLFYFKKIESDLSKSGTYVFCHDWNYGRGTYIRSYLESNNYKNWECIEIVDRLAILRKK